MDPRDALLRAHRAADRVGRSVWPSVDRRKMLHSHRTRVANSDRSDRRPTIHEQNQSAASVRPTIVQLIILSFHLCRNELTTRCDDRRAVSEFPYDTVQDVLKKASMVKSSLIRPANRMQCRLVAERHRHRTTVYIPR